MKRIRILVALAFVAVFSIAQAADGLIVVQSLHTAQETMDKLEAIVKEKGLKVFARIDHAAGAASVDKALRPTELAYLW